MQTGYGSDTEYPDSNTAVILDGSNSNTAVSFTLLIIHIKISLFYISCTIIFCISTAN